MAAMQPSVLPRAAVRHQAKDYLWQPRDKNRGGAAAQSSTPDRLRVRRKAEKTSCGLRQKKTMSIAHGLFIGVTGFEPTTPSSLTKCASQLRYTPI